MGNSKFSITEDDWQDYIQAAMRFEDKSLIGFQRMRLAKLGLIGEFGEVSELIKKATYHGKKELLAKVPEEIGDVLWYRALFENVQNLSPRPATWMPYIRYSQLELLCIDATANMFQNPLLGYLETMLQTHFSSNLKQVMESNIKKLQSRYPDGFVKGGGIRLDETTALIQPMGESPCDCDMCSWARKDKLKSAEERKLTQMLEGITSALGVTAKEDPVAAVNDLHRQIRSLRTKLKKVSNAK